MSRAGVVSPILEFSSTRCPGTAPSWKQSYGVYLSQRTSRVWNKVGITRWQSVFVVLWMKNALYKRPGHLNIWSLAGGVAWGKLGCAALLDQDRYCEQETLQLHTASSSFLPCGYGWGCELCSSHHTWWTLSPSGTIAKINLFSPRKLLRAMVFYHCSIEAGNAVTETGAQKMTGSVCALSEFLSLSISSCPTKFIFKKKSKYVPLKTW